METRRINSKLCLKEMQIKMLDAYTNGPKCSLKTLNINEYVECFIRNQVRRQLDEEGFDGMNADFILTVSDSYMDIEYGCEMVNITGEVTFNK